MSKSEQELEPDQPKEETLEEDFLGAKSQTNQANSNQLPCEAGNMIKEKPREKKKSNNNNNGNNSGSTSGGSGGSNLEIKSEPVERDREREREADVKEEPDEIPGSGEKSTQQSPVADVKTSVQSDVCLPETGKTDESSIIDNQVPCKTLKNDESETEFGSEMGESVLPMLGPDPLLDGVQPLASNVINKQPGTMEAQYMQQQSQIFVFSTALANKSAESVLQGQYASIIAYHCAQPRTKKYLEKHPLKTNQFNRQNPAQWLNNLAQMKQKGQAKCMGLNRAVKPSNMMMDVGHPGMPGMHVNRMPMWNQSCSAPLKPGPGGPPIDGQGPMTAGSPNSNAIINSLSDFADTDPMGVGPHHSLAGVKVPDENLTPQQRQHREEQLATLRKMQQMLFPENHSPGEVPSGQPPTGPNALTMPASAAGGGGSTDLDEVIPLTSDPNDIAMSPHPHPKGQPPMTAQAEWQKMQLQFYEERKKKPCPSTDNNQAMRNRNQGPPPPYHPTTRSASVPVAMPSPNPSSPNNTTSNLSLPSPRTCSGLNSPAGRNPPGAGPSPSHESPAPPSTSNPGTPHSPPSKKEKLNGGGAGGTPVAGDFSPTPSSQHSPDGMFCRSLQSLAQKQQSALSKEPNLMPVPSPQQIQYLNAFEGQELTIQKQPNTSLKEPNMSPTLPPTSLESVLPTSGTEMSGSKVSGPLTPSSLDMQVSRGVFAGSSPSPGTSGDKSRSSGQGAKTDLRFSCNSPQMADNMNQSRFPIMGSSPVLPNNFMPQQSGKLGQQPFLDVSPNSKPQSDGNPVKEGIVPSSGAPTGTNTNYQCIGPDNVPLNPNGITRLPGVNSGKAGSHFDPITSLAQMSQQLTTNVASAGPNQQNNMMHPGMMGFNQPSANMHLMQMNDMGVCQDNSRMANAQMPHSFSPGSNGQGRMMPCQGPNNSISPKPGMMQPGPGAGYPPRMMTRPNMPNSYNGAGANIQVKPSAPNTIQYLPTRPQGQATGPRGPPSLDFLQRFSNPLSNLDAKVPTHNLQYFPNNYQQNNVNSNEMMGGMMRGGGMRGGGGVGVGVGVGVGGGGMRMGGMSGGGVGVGGAMPPQVNFPGDGGGGMFPCPMPGGPGPGPGPGHPPDASQPLPPSMGNVETGRGYVLTDLFPTESGQLSLPTLNYRMAASTSTCEGGTGRFRQLTTVYLHAMLSRSTPSSGHSSDSFN
ncbi:hypothetical protein LSTR_LSTR007620 [Laodelphax striatellus]|uniref:B-cell lymphoma 9 beta-catenin binding domain-containing protein n=1 Tax=Laodelphax striatellus TaxID=195883 RepID=A0A482WID9_LAOST|nr:hypothetical protein LSTR_LSTR007620 [Laodelphax striatellus]